MHKCSVNWNKFKRSGTIYRRAKKMGLEKDQLHKKVYLVPLFPAQVIPDDNKKKNNLDTDSNSAYVEYLQSADVEDGRSLNYIEEANSTDAEDDDSDSVSSKENLYLEEDFREDIKYWAIGHNISHMAHILTFTYSTVLQFT